MHSKITIITVVKNGMPYLPNCLKSYELQDYKNKNLIVVYSESRDQTLEFLKKKKNQGIIDKLIIDNHSRNKFGALNIALDNVESDYFGILHADDIFFSPDTLSKIVNKFDEEKKIEVIFGNVIFCSKENIINFKRFWKSSEFKKEKLSYGWMPPHTSIFLKRNFLNLRYDANYHISADYNYILQLFEKNPRTFFYDRVITLMRLGGDSTGFSTFYIKFLQDFKIIQTMFKNLVFLRLMLKIIRKLNQFFFSKKKFSIDKNYIKQFKT